MAGRKSIDLDGDKLRQFFQATSHFFDIEYTGKKRLADTIVKERFSEFEVFVAVGGDGTINEVGREVTGTDKIMGIVPNGSGNGLARTLNIPLDVDGALEKIRKMVVEKIDAVMVNDAQYFFNVAGIGFDAYVAHKFDKLENRGLAGYVNVILKKFFFYQSKKFKFSENGHSRKEKAFLISFANNSQYGNNAHIAPMAKYDDGKFDLCILKSFPWWKTPELAVRLFNKSIHESKYYSHQLLEELLIERKGKIIAHLDGEPFVFKNELKLEVLPKALQVITGN